VHAADRRWFRVARRGARRAASGSARSKGPAGIGHRLGWAVTAVALVATVVSLSVAGTQSGPVSADSVGQASTVQPPIVPGSGTAYLGAFVDPDGTALTAGDPTGGVSSLEAELGSLPDFNQQSGRSPSILSTFQNWTEPVDVAGLDSVAATGALPMVTWKCGDTDANVAAGADDAMVRAEALGLAATDVPVLLRWFPDPNLTNGSAGTSCLGADGASGYVAAYQHIHSLFVAAGATNVAFVWSVDMSSTADPNFANYFPGGKVVDWIAADSGATPSDTSRPAAFTSEFALWYSAFSAAGKPMMVSSTGADSASQPAYFGQILAALPAHYPQIKALIYFDAPDLASGDQYQLGTAGATSFQLLAASPVFNPTRAPSQTTVSPSQTSLPVGTSVTLTASVNASDNSGSVSFLDNGSGIPGCVFVPITTPVRCQTSQLTAGVQSIVAAYGGDAAFGSSTSAPANVTVEEPGLPSGASRPSSQLSTATSSGSTTSTSSDSDAAVGTADQPQDPSKVLVPAEGSAYVGSFVDPTGNTLRPGNPTGGISSLSSELTALPPVQQTLARPLSIVPVFLNWNDSITVTELDQVVATGGVPMITWNCGAKDSNVIAGRDDSLIDSVATKLAQFQLPVFLRWFPDPNANAGTACLAKGGAAGYVAAYRHIHDRLVAAGASNVTFVWSVNTTSPQASQSWSSFYPGAQYVDWIGADGYATSSSTESVANDFGAWYANFSGEKPLMISQTAAIPALQAQYIEQLSTVPVQFPQVRAVVYFDAPDVTSGRSYELIPQSAGQQQLTALSGLPTFQPVRTVTTTSVTVSANPVSEGQAVSLSAQVSNADPGGYLTFYDNGSVLPGCGAVPLDLAGSCDTSSLTVATNQILVDYSGDAVSGASASAPVDVVVTSTPRPVGPPAIPGPGQAYLGAWVRPAVSHIVLPPHAAILEELQDLTSFNAGLQRPLSIVHMYQAWANAVSNHELQQVLADGAIPMIDWRCGDSDANIIAGSDDALITAEAQELAALKAPVFLRWYYEPNFTSSANYAACIGSLGPAGYVAAFRHIHDLFAAAGASNVAFVFSMASSGNDRDLYEYYPGSSYVDWIAVDGYSKTSVPDPTDFADRFGPWYSDFAAFGKPMMISETGAFAGGQASYFQQMKDQLSPTGDFPLIKAVLYFDAPGQGGLYTYPLDQSGLGEFESLSASPMFQPSRSASSVAVNASPASSMVGHRVVLDAQLSNTDFGGSTTFFVNGTPLAGCQSLPATAVSWCNTTSLPAGNNSITAIYSGDAEVAGSTATTESKVISSAPTGPSGSGTSSSGPVSAFPPFLGLPDIGGVSALGFPGHDGALFSFPLTLSLPIFSTSSHPGGGSDLDPIVWGRDIVGGGGVEATLVRAGGVLLLLLVAYMVSTWTQDRRRERRRKNSSLGSSSSAETDLSESRPSTPEAVLP
jgi:beta-mannanase